MRLARSALALCLVAIPPPAESAAASETAPSVSATASKTQLTVGEQFVVDVTASGPAGTTWTFPEEPGNEEVELQPLADDSASPQPSPPPQAMRRYSASVFTLADTAVPAIRVGYRYADGRSGEVATEPVPLHVVSLLPRDPKDQKLADIRGPVPLTVGRSFWIALLGGALLLAAAAWAIRRRRKAQTSSVSVPELAPDAEALAALARLEASGLLSRGDYRSFYIALTETAKRYLERRLAAPVLEMTTSEMAAFLRENAHGQAALPTMRDLTGAADRIKFARGDGLADEALRHLVGGREMIAALEARLNPPPVPDGEKVA